MPSWRSGAREAGGAAKSRVFVTRGRLVWGLSTKQARAVGAVWTFETVLLRSGKLDGRRQDAADTAAPATGTDRIWCAGSDLNNIGSPHRLTRV